ncbi:MAG: hypothetical protein HC834_10580 [Rhodospirillales bacterium]|nr:hypothetical protein [Rhodospirillales bacterium]
MMQVVTHQVIDVITVWNRLMAAIRTVLVPGIVFFAGVLRRAIRRICVGDIEPVFVDVVAMRVMQMTVVQVVDVLTVFDRSMTAVFPVLMGVLLVLTVATLAHRFSPCAFGDPSSLSHAKRRQNKRFMADEESAWVSLSTL